MSDLELLSAYVRERSQIAFSQLVERHTNLVFSVARQHVRDSHLAEDVVQQVFTLLAAKAPRLRADTIMSAWLYRATRNIASDLLRKETRRIRREQAASEYLDASETSNESPRTDVLLGDALQQLSASDQTVLLLRFFENKSLDEVGEAMNLSADAAQKRVSRALEKLRRSFDTAGVSLSPAGVAEALSACGLKLAPTGLAKAACEAALAHSRLAQTGLLTSVPHPFALMTTTQLKLSGFVLILVTLLFTGIVLYHQNQNLRGELNRLKNTALASKEPTSAGLLPPSQAQDLNWRVSMDRLELLGLRSRVAQLTAELRRATNHDDAGAAEKTASPVGEPDSVLFSAALTNLVRSGQTLVTGGWSMAGMRGYALATALTGPSVDAGTRKVTVHFQTIGAPESFWESIGWEDAKSGGRRSSIAAVLTPTQVDLLLTALKNIKEAEISNVSSVTGDDGELMQVTWVMDDSSSDGLMMGIDLYPRLSADSNTIELGLSPSKPPADASRIHGLLRQPQP